MSCAWSSSCLLICLPGGPGPWIVQPPTREETYPGILLLLSGYKTTLCCNNSALGLAGLHSVVSYRETPFVMTTGSDETRVAVLSYKTRL